jgi:hypothetical protein
MNNEEKEQQVCDAIGITLLEEKAAFYTVTKETLFAIAKEYFRSRGIPEALLYDVIYRHQINIRARKKKLKP